jgi:hypothetical protein
VAANDGAHQPGGAIHDTEHPMGKHGVRSTKQAIAIGLSEARRAGIDVPAKKAARTRAQR